MSVVHFHYDSGEHDDGIEYKISQVTNDCAICASHFKFTFDFKPELESFISFNSSVNLDTNKTAQEPIVGKHKGRSPPSTVS